MTHSGQRYACKNSLFRVRNRKKLVFGEKKQNNVAII